MIKKVGDQQINRIGIDISLVIAVLDRTAQEFVV
jgi:hypothetical protein